MDAKCQHRIDERTREHTWSYDDGTRLSVVRAAPDGRGRQMFTAKAFVGNHLLNHARIDLQNQDDRAKFHANTHDRMAQLNGAVTVEHAKTADWFGRLVEIIPLLEEAQDPESPRMEFTRLGDLLSEPDTAIEWVVDGLLPVGGLSTLTAKPKVGKSTLARDLALAVATGSTFLRRSTAPGAAIYLALEEKRSQVRKHFEAMGATGDEAIYIYAATAPADALAQIREAVEQETPALLIIDPLFRFTRVRDQPSDASP